MQPFYFIKNRATLNYIRNRHYRSIISGISLIIFFILCVVSGVQLYHMVRAERHRTTLIQRLNKSKDCVAQLEKESATYRRMYAIHPEQETSLVDFLRHLRAHIKNKLFLEQLHYTPKEMEIKISGPSSKDLMQCSALLTGHKAGKGLVITSFEGQTKQSMQAILRTIT